MSKQHFHTDWKPQFGDPILLPKKSVKPKGRKHHKGSWAKPSEAMRQSELAKCRITRLDPSTGQIIKVIEPTSHAGTKRYGETGRAPHKPRKQ